MKCKKSIMGFAALLILVFHFYIPISGSQLEIFLTRSAYIGVDLFFFVSAYSFGMKEKIEYWPFIKNRILNIYLPFLVMAIIAAFYKKWTITRFFEVISGVEFYKRGGGSFLWFVIAIMIFYLITPLFVKLKSKMRIGALPVLLGVWAILAVIFQYVLHQKKIFIMVNRMPVFILGMFYEDLRKILPKKVKLLMAVLLYVAGSFIVYKWGTTVRLIKPFYDMFYVLAIPMIIGIVGIFEGISEIIKIRNIPLSFLGKMTFELYGLQMIFGYDLEMKIFSKTKNGLVSFLITIGIIILAAYVFCTVKKLIIKIKEKIKNEKVFS